jgi:hypothetical protein
VLSDARRGIAFDEMAILVRAPHQYHGLLEHALSRAGIPAFFDRGTRRPHPAGRAFLALIAAAVEGLSARRVAEYLSLGQLPAPDQPPSTWARSTDDVLAGGVSEEEDEAAEHSLDAREEDAGGCGDCRDAARTAKVGAPARRSGSDRRESGAMAEAT